MVMYLSLCLPGQRARLALVSSPARSDVLKRQLKYPRRQLLPGKGERVELQPGLARGACHINVHGWARHVLGPDVAVDALRAMIGPAKVPGAAPDVRGPGLGDGKITQEDGVLGETRHVLAA